MPAVTEPPSVPAAPGSLEARLLAWLRNSMGLNEDRRVARVDAVFPEDEVTGSGLMAKAEEALSFARTAHIGVASRSLLT